MVSAPDVAQVVACESPMRRAVAVCKDSDRSAEATEIRMGPQVTFENGSGHCRLRRRYSLSSIGNGSQVLRPMNVSGGDALNTCSVWPATRASVRFARRFQRPHRERGVCGCFLAHPCSSESLISAAASRASASNRTNARPHPPVVLFAGGCRVRCLRESPALLCGGASPLPRNVARLMLSAWDDAERTWRDLPA
jgi:hypothetical protein